MDMNSFYNKIKEQGEIKHFYILCPNSNFRKFHKILIVKKKNKEFSTVVFMEAFFYNWKR